MICTQDYILRLRLIHNIYNEHCTKVLTFRTLFTQLVNIYCLLSSFHLILLVNVKLICGRAFRFR